MSTSRECNDSNELIKKSIGFSHDAVVSANGNYHRINFWYARKGRSYVSLQVIVSWKTYIFYWFHYKLLADIGLFFTLLFIVTLFIL